MAQNTTVDDHDYSRITYTTVDNWSHDPLQGYEQFFVNGSRSFSYVPGASASFTFTGTGIYLQGTYSNDQAMRQVTLDGQDMGTYAAYAVERLPAEGTSAVFWGTNGLENKEHTVVIAHADTGDKILVLDAWIYETQSASISGSAPSTSTTDGNNTGNSSTTSTNMPMSSNMGIIIGVVVTLVLLLLLCIAGFCLLRRRRQRRQQEQTDSNKEKYLSQPHRLSGPVYPISPQAKANPTEWRESTVVPALEYIPENPIAVPERTASPPSHPSFPGGRAASDTYMDNSLGLSNHPLFIPTPDSVSSGSHYPTPPEYPGAPTRFFHQQPDPPTSAEYTGQPIINAPSSPSALRRLSTTLAGIVPAQATRALSPNRSPRIRSSSIVYERAAKNNNDADLERNGSPRNSYFSGTDQPIPLSPISAISPGFARQSQNLDKVESDGRPSPSETGTPKADPFDDGYAFSSYTRQTRNEVRQTRE